MASQSDLHRQFADLEVEKTNLYHRELELHRQLSSSSPEKTPTNPLPSVQRSNLENAITHATREQQLIILHDELLRIATLCSEHISRNHTTVAFWLSALRHSTATHQLIHEGPVSEYLSVMELVEGEVDSRMRTDPFARSVAGMVKVIEDMVALWAEKNVVLERFGAVFDESEDDVVGEHARGGSWREHESEMRDDGDNDASKLEDEVENE